MKEGTDKWTIKERLGNYFVSDAFLDQLGPIETKPLKFKGRRKGERLILALLKDTQWRRVKGGWLVTRLPVEDGDTGLR